MTRPAGGRSGAYGGVIVVSRVLFHEDFGDGRALAYDVEAVGGILDADALEVVVFGGSVG